MIFRRPAKPRPRKRDALSAQQTETGGGLTPMLYLERWGNMTNRLTPSRLSSILQAADDGDIAEQHVLFADKTVVSIWRRKSASASGPC